MVLLFLSNIYPAIIGIYPVGLVLVYCYRMCRDSVKNSRFQTAEPEPAEPAASKSEANSQQASTAHH